MSVNVGNKKGYILLQIMEGHKHPLKLLLRLLSLTPTIQTLIVIFSATCWIMQAYVKTGRNTKTLFNRSNNCDITIKPY